jgi:hypothetical protein
MQEQSPELELALITDSLSNSGIVCARDGSFLNLGFEGDQISILFFPASLHQCILESGKLEI